MPVLPRLSLVVLVLATALPAGALQPLAVAWAQEEGPAPAPEAGRAGLEELRRYAGGQARARRFAEAIRAYERLLAQSPGDAEALSRRAQLLAWSGDYDRSIVAFRDAIARRPRDLGLRSDLADVLTWAKRLEEAERLYEEVLAADPGHHEALKGLARARLLRGETAAAAPVLERALALYPRDVDVRRDRAQMLSQRGDLEGALSELRKAVDLAPADVGVRRRLADVLLRKKDWQAAADAWQQVARLEPDSAGSHVGLARAYLGLEKVSLAREHLGLALRMSPNDADASQLSRELEREARFAPYRSASELFELIAYATILPLVLVVVRRARRVLRRRPAAYTFAAYLVPAFLVLNIGSHVAKAWLWRHLDERMLEAVTEVVLFLGMGVALVAMLRVEPAVREFAGQVVLALGAHPDDIELGTAGFLLKLKASGARVYGLTMTRGEKGTDQNGKREQEARRAAAFLGLDGYWILDFPDVGLQEKIPAMKEAIEGKVRELGATMVLTHSDVDVHGDHRAVHAATREAARSVPTAFCYEDVSTTNRFTPDLYVDISNYIDDHLKACAIHRTQQHRTYMDPQVIRGRAAHRGMQINVSFAQAFRTLNLVR